MDLSEVFIKKIHRYIGEAPTGKSQRIIPTFWDAPISGSQLSSE
jgi:hypothetical protein